MSRYPSELAPGMTTAAAARGAAMMITSKGITQERPPTRKKRGFV